VKTFSITMNSDTFYNDFSALHTCAMVLYVPIQRCIFETAASICICETPLESLINGLIGTQFISTMI